MAVTLREQDLRQKFKFQAQRWKDFDEFKEFEIRYLQEKLPDWIYFEPSKGKEEIFKPIDHHPKLELYEVWMEGYRATGEAGEAQKLGEAHARNFGQACHIIVAKSILEKIEEENNPFFKGHATPGRWDYDPSALSIWACRLFWSEELARKSFG